MSCPTLPARPRPSPAFVSISECQAKSPSMQTSAEHSRSSFIFPSYLFILPFPPPSSHSSEKKRLNGRGGQERMNKDACVPGPNGGFSGGECGRRRRNGELTGLKGGWFPAEDSTSSGDKGGDGGPAGKAANTCFLFRGHNRKLKLQSLPPGSQRPLVMGLSYPTVVGTRGGRPRGLTAWAVSGRWALTVRAPQIG